MPSAIIVGATGILGRAIVNRLACAPTKWPMIYALSRSQTETFPAGVIHLKVDLNSTPPQLAEELKGIQADYLFFNAYVQRASAREEYEINGALLHNFLEAMSLTGAEKTLKRVLIPGGGKQYGLHLGPAKQPCEENDHRIDGPQRPPNFYYLQQDILKEYSAGKGWDWVVTLPNNVVGSTRGYDSFTSSALYAEFNEWAALEPKCSNQIYNVVNGDIQSWQNLWPKIAKYFGVRIPSNQFTTLAPLPSRFEIDQPAPLTEYAETAGLLGVIEDGVVVQRLDLVQWSKRPDVKKAWQAIAKREDLEQDALEKASFMFAGLVLGRNFDIVMNMTKARKFGWTGYADSWDSYMQTFEELGKEHIIPAFH